MKHVEDRGEKDRIGNVWQLTKTNLRDRYFQWFVWNITSIVLRRYHEWRYLLSYHRFPFCSLQNPIEARDGPDGWKVYRLILRLRRWIEWPNSCLPTFVVTQRKVVSFHRRPRCFEQASRSINLSLSPLRKEKTISNRKNSGAKLRAKVFQ